MNQLQQLKKFSHVVADTGDIDAVQRFQPQDATTNPSLLLKAAQLPNYRALVDDALAFGRRSSANTSDQLQAAMDRLAVNFGVELSRIVPGRVSTEVEASRSFDCEATVTQAHRLINLYQQAGVDRDRILIKIAATWEGIQAAKQLEQQGIQCNLTLLFSFAQAVACAQAGVYLISPFVGRILDWYQHKNQTTYSSDQDPGVLSVKKIYHYYKRFDIKTIVMGASFRNLEQIRQLAGCDRLTIGPQWLEALALCDEPLPTHLDDTMHQSQAIQPCQFNESQFRWQLNEDAMATEKLAEGIRLFYQDHQKLQDYLAQLI